MNSITSKLKKTDILIIDDHYELFDSINEMVQTDDYFKISHTLSNDIDFNNSSFKITRKGGNEVVLYFSDEVKSALLNWLEERNHIETIDKNEKALFLSLQRKRITPRAVENLVKKYALAIAPLKKISPHKLRSTYGTNLYRETQDIYIVADVLGHKDVNTTKKHYAAISEDIRRNASTKVKLR